VTNSLLCACVVGATCLLASCGPTLQRAPSSEEGVRGARQCAEETRKVSWDHLEGGWTQLAPPPFPRARAISVWAGSQLILWGGDTGYGGTHHADGAAYNPASDSWRKLAPSPLSERSSSGAVWTGCAVIVWGGYSGRELDDGAAYDPATDSWRMLPESPLDGRVPVAMVWTGDEVIVWGDMERPNPSSDGAAYDPATDRWRKIAEAPVELNLAEAAWTGKEMIVLGAKLDNNNASHTRYAQGAAYNLSSDSWRMLPSHPISPQASSIAWTGSEVVVWDYEPVAAAYHPERNAWRDVPDPPLDPSECYPRSAFAEGLMFAHFCGQGAVYYAAEDQWRPIAWGERYVAGRPVAAEGAFLFAGASHESTNNALWAFKPAR
jgi:hypothetical protein